MLHCYLCIKYSHACVDFPRIYIYIYIIHDRTFVKTNIHLYLKSNFKILESSRETVMLRSHHWLARILAYITASEQTRVRFVIKIRAIIIFENKYSFIVPSFQASSALQYGCSLLRLHSAYFQTSHALICIGLHWLRPKISSFHTCTFHVIYILIVYCCRKHYDFCADFISL